MKAKKSNLFTGILLVGLGAFALAQSMGYVVSQKPIVWALVFGGVSLLSLVFYLMDGVKAWGWLFPVGIFGALSFLLTMVANDVDNTAMVAPLFFGIGLPRCLFHRPCAQLVGAHPCRGDALPYVRNVDGG